MRRTPEAMPPSEVILKKPMSPRAPDVGAAAELGGLGMNAHHPDPVAVLLAEQRHRAGLLRLVQLHHLRLGAGVVADPPVDQVLHLSSCSGVGWAKCE